MYTAAFAVGAYFPKGAAHTTPPAQGASAPSKATSGGQDVDDRIPASLYLLNGDQYYRFPADGGAIQSGGPICRSSTNPPGTTPLLPGGLVHGSGRDSVDFSKDLNATLSYGGAGDVYLFKGSYCWRVSIQDSAENDTSPKLISDAFPKLPSAFNQKIDAALPYIDPKSKKRYVWFFSGTKCCLWQENEHSQLVAEDISIWGLNGAAIDAAGPQLKPDGTLHDAGYIFYGDQHVACTPSTHTTVNPTNITDSWIAPSGTKTVTDTGPGSWTVPLGVEQMTFELWGPGGHGGNGGAAMPTADQVGGRGGNGSAGVYLKDILAVSQYDTLLFHVGGPGEATTYGPGYGTLVAGGGGNGGYGGDAGPDSDGGNGGNAGYGRYGGGYGGEPGGDASSTGGGSDGGGGGDGAGYGYGSGGVYGGGNGGRGAGGGGRGGFGGGNNVGADGGAGYNAANALDGGGGGGGGASLGGGNGGNGGAAGNASGNNSGDGGGYGAAGAGGGGGSFTGGGGGLGGGGGTGWDGHGPAGGGGGGGMVAGGGGGGGGLPGKPWPESAHVGYGSGTTPDGNPPNGHATGGQGGTSDNTGSTGTSGAIRFSW